MRRYFLLQCPHCGNQMKYHTPGVPGSKRKVCVYCGKSYKVRDHIIRAFK